MATARDSGAAGSAQRVAVDRDARSLGRRGLLAKRSHAAVVHADLDVIERLGARTLFDLVAGESATDRADDRHGLAAVAAAGLVAHRGAEHAAGDRAEAGAFALDLHL